MNKTIDARGAACPQPVIETKKALETCDTVITIVDNDTALENLRRLADNLNCIATCATNNDGIYVTISKSGASPVAPSAVQDASAVKKTEGATLMVVSQDVMGKGDDALGQVLIRAFFHTLAETDPAPDTIVFFNSGVNLLTGISDVIEDIKILEEKNIKILACGTCLDYYRIKDVIAAGTVTNMYEIKELMFSARKIINL